MVKSMPKCPLTGRWRIVSMDEWDVDDMEEEGPAFIEFGADQMGEFQFGLTSGNIDFRITERGGSPPPSGPGKAWTRWTPAPAGAGPSLGNLWGRDCVVLHRRDGGVLRIGTDDPENLARFLGGKTPRPPS